MNSTLCRFFVSQLEEFAMHRSAFVSPQNMLLWDIRGDDLYHVPPSNPNPGFLVPMDAAFLFSKVAELHVKHGHSLTSVETFLLLLPSPLASLP